MNKQQSSRLFIAVPVSQRVTNTLSDWVQGHQQKLPFRKWTHPADYHITLQFLGETSPPVINKLIETLQHVTFEPFSLSLGQIGVFGQKASPRILWASVVDSTQALKELQRQIVKRTELVGFETEKREFRAHLTLARDYRGDRSFQLSDISDQPDASSWEVNHFTVMKSNVKSTPMYEVVHTFHV
ncbi:RNA 2',3'-cyclic phosphodiesterase [Paenibacillus sp. FSL W7-1287]|uniref:RNA 2',3'-cyclic phosphodiesterase n=1 Tax=Paenibacillus sp. FSL W7-1287 TaxID=2954538 RepID=UPI0030FC551A